MPRKANSHSAFYRSRGTAQPCVGAAWQQLLGPYLDPEEPAATEADCALDETENILFALALAMEQRDHQTAGHCERLALMAVAMGVAMRLSHANLVALYRGGYLHDIGKVGIPDSILFKPGKLTLEEWTTMQSHTWRGEEICRPMGSLASVLPIIRHHHERWDGSGYPDHLRGEEIPLVARVLQVVDIYDALISARPYKSAWTPERALEIIREETRQGWRDPQITELFIQLHRDGLSKVAAWATASAEARQLASMRESLLNLQRCLGASDALPQLAPQA
jgi:putative nucleotidyltransferase with HDIG domain